MATTDPSAAWTSLRVRLWLVRGLALATLVTALPPLKVHGLAVWFAGVSIGALVWLLAFRCPACGKPFFRKGGWQNVLARGCVHCGLPRYAPPPPGAP